MANAHSSTIGRTSVLFDERQIRREERRVEREMAQQRKLERMVKRINSRGGR